MELPDWLIAWSKLPSFEAAATVCVSLLVAILLDVVIRRVLIRLAMRTKTRDDDRLVAILHPPIPLTVFGFGLWTALNRLPLPDPLPFVMKGCFLTVCSLYWAQIVLRVADLFLNIASRINDRKGLLQARTIPFFDLASKLVVYALGSYVVLLAWGIDVTAWLASAGIIGLAVGFAAQDTLSHIFAGLFILMDGPYKLGDWLILETGERGEVVELGLRSTRILTQDDVEIVVPNALIANGKIVNASGGPHIKERVKAFVGIAYGSDIDAAKSLLRETAMKLEGVAESPEPQVVFVNFGDSSLDLEVMVWVDHPRMRAGVLDQLNTQIYKALNAAEIEIPFPQRDVNMRQ